MSAEMSVVLGLGLVSGLLAFYAWVLSQSEQELNQKIGLLLALMSLVFLNLVMFAIYKISDTSLSYLVAGVMKTGLFAMMWTTLILVAIMLLTLVYMALMFLAGVFKNMGKKKDLTDEYQ